MRCPLRHAARAYFIFFIALVFPVLVSYSKKNLATVLMTHNLLPAIRVGNAPSKQ
jgi:hypothetical protein